MNNYTILETKYGIYLQLKDKWCYHDIKDTIKDFVVIVNRLKNEFSIILDLRDIAPICPEVARVLTYAKAYLLGKGLKRTAIIYSTSATIMHLMENFAELSHDYNEKHISSLVNKNWKEIAENWVINGVEP